jgi:hypothetical protein
MCVNITIEYTHLLERFCSQRSSSAKPSALARAAPLLISCVNFTTPTMLCATLSFDYRTQRSVLLRVRLKIHATTPDRVQGCRTKELL